jgi:hypothetical protein
VLVGRWAVKATPDLRGQPDTTESLELVERTDSVVKLVKLAALDHVDWPDTPEEWDLPATVVSVGTESGAAVATFERHFWGRCEGHSTTGLSAPQSSE